MGICWDAEYTMLYLTLAERPGEGIRQELRDKN